MHQVKLAPFGGAERAEDGMVDDRVAAEAGFAFLNQVVQAGDVSQNFSSDFFRRNAAGKSALWGLAAGRKVSNVDYEEAGEAITAAVGTGGGGAGLQAALEAFDGAGVAEIEVFENLSGAPLPFRVASELVRRKIADGGSE